MTLMVKVEQPEVEAHIPGFSHAVAGIMAATALATGRRTTFDPKTLNMS
jgi:hypothetical protein